MSDLIRIQAQLDAMSKRLRAVERWVKPLLALEGVDQQVLCDQAVVDFIARNAGTRLDVVAGSSRTREATEARRFVVQELAHKVRWPVARIARALNRTDQGVRKILRQDGR
jgi:hypothetical protein